MCGTESQSKPSPTAIPLTSIYSLHATAIITPVSPGRSCVRSGRGRTVSTALAPREAGRGSLLLLLTLPTSTLRSPRTHLQTAAGLRPVLTFQMWSSEYGKCFDCFCLAPSLPSSALSLTEDQALGEICGGLSRSGSPPLLNVAGGAADVKAAS